MTRLLRCTLLLVVVVAAAVVLGTGAALPPEVASHFGYDGTANGSMSRAAYFGVMTALVVVVPMLLAFTSGAMPRWSRRNRSMRHPDYWLAPPR